MNTAAPFTKSIEEIDDGWGFRLTSTDNFPVLATDKVYQDCGQTKRKIGVSLTSGCRVGCLYCFTRKLPHFRPLTTKEILAQVEEVQKTGLYCQEKVNETKISFKQMGDPLLNPDNTLEAIKLLHQQNPGFGFVISTSGPRQNLDFFSQLKDLVLGGVVIRLQFSLHTTSDHQRKILSPKLQMLSLGEIAAISNGWQGSLVTLNFVLLKDFEYDSAKMIDLFLPDKVFIKLNYLDYHQSLLEQGLEDAPAFQSLELFSALQDHGFTLAFRKGRQPNDLARQLSA